MTRTVAIISALPEAKLSFGNTFRELNAHSVSTTSAGHLTPKCEVIRTPDRGIRLGRIPPGCYNYGD
jgi:hypothetical protein